MKALIESELSIHEYIRVHLIRQDGTLSAAAKRMGVSLSFVSAVIAGRKRPTRKVLDYVGLEALVTTTYRKKRQ